jgi:hypothetical protein
MRCSAAAHPGVTTICANDDDEASSVAAKDTAAQQRDN